MIASRRLIIIASSASLLLILTISLAASLDFRSSPRRTFQIAIAQAAKQEQSDRDLRGKSRINDTGFDRADILSGVSTLSPGHPSTIAITLEAKPTPMTITDEGMIGVTHIPQQRPSTIDEGYIGPSPTPQTSLLPSIAPAPQTPILVLSYASSGGPKHCRGDLIQSLSLPPPASAYTNGTCISLPEMARCGVFYAGKDAGCEAKLFNMEGCLDTKETYVNTVVFMPEERTVGALWKSMWIRCGVEAPDAKMLDPALLEGLLKKPGGG